MSRFFASCLTLYWTVFFGALAFGGVRALDGAQSSSLAGFGIELGAPESLLAVLPAVVFTLATAIFLWSFMNFLIAADDAYEGARLAFGVGFVAFSALTLLASLSAEPGVSTAAGVQLIALLGSYFVLWRDQPSVAARATIRRPSAEAINLARLEALAAGRKALLKKQRSAIIYEFPGKGG